MNSNGFTAPMGNGSTNNGGNLPLPTPIENSSASMPLLGMNSPRGMRAIMPNGDMNISTENGQLVRVLVELQVSREQGLMGVSQAVNFSGFELDSQYQPVPINPTSDVAPTLLATGTESYIVRGAIREEQIPELEAQANVIKVYKDTPIAPFNPSSLLERVELQQTNDKAKCPTGDCDCAPTVAKGTLADVAKYFGVDQIWSAGYRGQGIVVGIVDGGITAEGRNVAPYETIRRIPNVIGGHLPDWGTKAAAWGEHGNMCATDVLGMAPEAKLYDLRLAGGDAISNALAAFQWAINQHKIDGTPHVLTNSWGIYRESWDKFYASNPSHPFTRKVVEAIEEGILVLFAAGNCGGTCPSDRCGSDAGPGRSIWGANGHPLVMTVGAANLQEQFVGYSSQGPAALDPNKPDFCAITHFRGYFGSDNGTSAACPIAAGVVALLKQAKPNLNQTEAKDLLKQTAKNLAEPGFDQNTGAGIIQPKVAFDTLVPELPRWSEWQKVGGNAFSAPTVVSTGGENLSLFVVGGDSGVYQSNWDGTAWSPEWINLDGFSLSAPAAIATQKDTKTEIELFILGQKRQVQRRIGDGNTWGEWENLSGFAKQGVSVCAQGNQRHIFTIGADNALYQMTLDGETSRGWTNLGGFCLSSPAVVSWGETRIDLVVRGGDHAIYHKFWDGSQWSDWISLGGIWLYAPAVATWGENHLEVFAVGTSNQLFRKSFNGTTWSDWESLGGICISAPTAIAPQEKQLEVFVVGGDNAIYRRSLL